MMHVKTVLKSKLIWLAICAIIGYLIFSHHSKLTDYIQIALNSSAHTEPFQYHSTTVSTVTSLDPSNYQFKFRGFYNNTLYVGKPFNSKWNKILMKLNLFQIKTIKDDVVLNTKPKIVTAFSDNHFGEAKRLVTKLNQVYGNEKILYVYNLGLSDDNKKEFLKEWPKMIVEFRNFSFHNYPDYVGNLFEYRWKPLIIAEMLLELKSFWWMDTSIQMKGQITSLYDDIGNCSLVSLCPYYPWIMPDEAAHSIFSTTDKRMTEYLPYPETLMKSYMMYGASLMLIYGTNKVKEEIVRLLVLCALEQGCMGPNDTTIYCTFTEDRFKDYAKCHRYDQSAVNILLAWANKFQPKRYTHHADNAFVLL